MAPRPYLLREVDWATAQSAQYSVAVLPWGATEAHNRHLPYGTDTIEVEAVAEEAARLAWEKGARALVLPAVPFGVQTSQRDIPFCLNMNPSTQAALLRDLIATLELSGIAKLVILNGHGGNDFRQIIRELQPATPVFLCSANWYAAASATDFFADPGDHAGELETAVMLHVAAPLVRPLSQAGDGRARRFRIEGLREGWAWAPRAWSQVSDDTGVGNPAGATVEAGRRFFDAAAAKIASFLTELGEADLDEMYE